MRFVKIFCLFFFTSLGLHAVGQDAHQADGLSIQHKKGFFHWLFDSRENEARKGKLIATPFFLPGYSPDIEFSVAAGTIFSFKTKQNDSLLPRSSVPVTVTYSSINAFIASSGWTTFWFDDKLRINALIQYKASRDAYYGIGYANAITTSFPDSTNFRRSFFIFQVRPLWKLMEHFYGGLTLEYSQNIIGSVNAHMAHDSNFLQFGSYIVNTGVGGILSYDSRDFPQNAYSGVYSAIIYTFYQKTTGGNTNFQALDFDTRYFISLGKKKGRVLALNWRSRYDFGQTPFTSMISLGTSVDLRGFRFGQFRDHYLNYFIAEYRYKFYHHQKPTRFGFVIWSGIGAIGGNFREAMFQRALPEAGIGLRFEIQPRLNARVDVGYAPPSAGSGSHTATYFNFLEAY